MLSNYFKDIEFIEQELKVNFVENDRQMYGDCDCLIFNNTVIEIWLIPERNKIKVSANNLERFVRLELTDNNFDCTPIANLNNIGARINSTTNLILKVVEKLKERYEDYEWEY